LANLLTAQDIDIVHRATRIDQTMVRAFLRKAHSELRAKLVAASHIAIALGRDEELRDPYEDDPQWANAVSDAQSAASAEITFDGLGRCHAVWERQAEILWETYQIRWYSPAQMNPWIEFD
jgi:hypothetical protein